MSSHTPRSSQRTGDKMLQKFLILGGEGFVGTHLYNELNARNYSVKRTVRSNSLSDLSGDINESLLDKCEKPDVIFHVAGGASVADSIDSPSNDFAKTLPNLNALLNKMKDEWQSSRLIYVSSAAVYGKNASSSTSVSTELAPISPYGFHKKLAEEMLVFYAVTYDLQVKIVRPFSLYGPGLRKQLFWDVLSKAEKGEFRFSGTGAQLRDWMYIEDFVQSLLTLAQCQWRSSEQILNVGTGEPLSISSAISLILSLAGYENNPLFMTSEDRKGDPRDLVAANNELNRELLHSKTPFEDGLKRYISWFKEVDK